MRVVKHYSASEQGRRDYNQDACIALQVTDDVWFFAIADGMGGAKGGEIASNDTIQTAQSVLKNYFVNSESTPDLKEVLQQIVIKSHEVIRDKKSQNGYLEAMGTTLTCLLIRGDQYAWANLGDSRIYRINHSDIQQLTVDHTYIQDYINNKGNIPADLAGKFDHYLLRVVDGNGQSADYFPQDKATETANNGDVFMLCSDGLIMDKIHTNTNLLKNYITGMSNLEEAGNALIQHAYHSGSDDNISIVLVEYGDMERKKLNLRRYYKNGEVIRKNKKRGWGLVHKILRIKQF